MNRTTLVMAALLAAGSMACTPQNRTADDQSNRDQTAMASPSPAASPGMGTSDQDMITAGQIAANPTKYVGQRVSVKGDVADIMNRNAFTLDEDRLTADQNLLVLSPNGGPTAAQKDQELHVEGTVRMYSSTELHRDYGWFKSTPDIEARFKERPVVIADAIRTADGRDLSTGSLPAGSGDEPRK